MPQRRAGAGCPRQPAGAAEGRRSSSPSHPPFCNFWAAGGQQLPRTPCPAPPLFARRPAGSPPAAEGIFRPAPSAQTDTQTHVPGALRSPTCSPASCWKHLAIGRLPSEGSSSLTARASPAHAPRPASARGHGAAPRSARLPSARPGWDRQTSAGARVSPASLGIHQESGYEVLEER